MSISPVDSSCKFPLGRVEIFIAGGGTDSSCRSRVFRKYNIDRYAHRAAVPVDGAPGTGTWGSRHP